MNSEMKAPFTENLELTKVSSFKFSQLGSVQDCIFETVQVFCLVGDGPFSSFQGRASSASFFHTYLVQVVDDVRSLVGFDCLSPHVVSQAWSWSEHNLSRFTFCQEFSHQIRKIQASLFSILPPNSAVTGYAIDGHDLSVSSCLLSKRAPIRLTVSVLSLKLPKV